MGPAVAAAALPPNGPLGASWSVRHEGELHGGPLQYPFPGRVCFDGGRAVD